MNKTRFKYFNIDAYYETLNNGLEVILIPNQKKKEVCMSFTTKFGSMDTEFKVGNKYKKFPNGIAHFLEHKVFEMEKGIDPFTFYSKSGSYNNAFTNYCNTTYLVSCNNKFYSNLGYLLNFVQSPYFTDENVEKEKGIISEEIKMYKDMPDSVLYEQVNRNLFINSNIKNTISGEVNDIITITKEDLYSCYNTFYQPKNMFLVISGKFNYKKTINFIKKNQAKKQFTDIQIERKNEIEPQKPFKEYEEIKHNVITPYVTYSLKIKRHIKTIDPAVVTLYINMLFDILFDETSVFYEKLTKLNIIDSPIDIDSLYVPDYRIIYFTFKSKKYKKAIELFNNELENIAVNEEDLERKKKVYISSLIYSFDDVSTVNNFVVRNIVRYNNINSDIYDKINKMNIDEMNYIISSLKYKKCIVVMKKN